MPPQARYRERVAFRDLIRRTFRENDQFGCSLMVVIAALCGLIGLVVFVFVGLWWTLKGGVPM